MRIDENELLEHELLYASNHTAQHSWGDRSYNAQTVWRFRNAMRFRDAVSKPTDDTPFATAGRGTVCHSSILTLTVCLYVRIDNYHIVYTITLCLFPRQFSLLSIPMRRMVVRVDCGLVFSGAYRTVVRALLRV